MRDLSTKECATCKRTYLPDGFYKNGNGSLAKHCKECTKAKVRAHRAANLERIREYDRQRGLLPHRKEAVKKRAHRYAGKYPPLKVTHPEARAAHVLVGNAVRGGRLTPQPCERCGTTENLHAHHEDYSKPLDVTWLCQPCHGERHREINEERRRSAA